MITLQPEVYKKEMVRIIARLHENKIKQHRSKDNLDSLKKWASQSFHNIKHLIEVSISMMSMPVSQIGSKLSLGPKTFMGELEMMDGKWKARGLATENDGLSSPAIIMHVINLTQGV